MAAPKKAPIVFNLDPDSSDSSYRKSVDAKLTEDTVSRVDNKALVQITKRVDEKKWNRRGRETERKLNWFSLPDNLN